MSSAEEKAREFLAIPDPLAGRSPARPLAPLSPAALGSGGPSPTRADMARRRRVALGLGALWALLIPLVFGLRGDLASPPVLLQVLLPALLACAALWTSQRPRRGLGPSAVEILALGAASSALFVATALLAPCEQRGATLVQNALVCGGIELAFSVVPVLLAAWALRRSAVVGPAARGAAVGLAVGFATATALTLHCPQFDGLHVLLGHGLPVLLALGLAALSLRRALRA